MWRPAAPAWAAISTGAIRVQLSPSGIRRVAQGVFVSRSHPLAGLARATRADLARHRQLVIKMEGVDERVLSPMVWRADSFYSIASMAVDGLGWAILPLNIAEYEAHRDQLASVPCAGSPCRRCRCGRYGCRAPSAGAAASWILGRMEQLLRAGG